MSYQYVGPSYLRRYIEALKELIKLLGISVLGALAVSAAIAAILFLIGKHPHFGAALGVLLVIFGIPALIALD